ncbi:MAG: tetratricopeptide repeat protein [Bacillota bacterium]|nr:tetratricopeptide repeat protein [Bacillota bacterium]
MDKKRYQELRYNSLITDGISERCNRSNRPSGNYIKREKLGGGLVSLPKQAVIDPIKLIMTTAEVPEKKRICPNCNEKVNRPTGFCPKCGAEYNFQPSLKAGDVINGRFEVKGPISFGGLGWIYLARDIILSRWVVLKGLLNHKNGDGIDASVTERQFLASVKHPKIVSIYDFIQYDSEGFIVMEYIGGKTLKSIRMERGPLPVEEAVSYILGILPAFSYLHSQGLVYCDFKPDNIMLEGDDVKLIDMGSVRKIGDSNGDIFGTTGYTAPEAYDDPVEVSDLYTIGRTLAVLIMDFKFQSEYEHSLPLPNKHPVLGKNESLYKFLLKALHKDINARFQSADEMMDQLYGVLREITSLNDVSKPIESQIFIYDKHIDSEDITDTEQCKFSLLPALKIDVNDICLNDLLKLSAMTDEIKKISFLKHLADKYGDNSKETRFRLADSYILAKDFTSAEIILKKLELEDKFDWRVHWYKGKLFLAQDNGASAKNEFEKVYYEIPGETAPKLALGYAFEKQNLLDDAIKYYNKTAKTDIDNAAACFGLARCFMKKNNIEGSANSLNLVPVNHSLYTQSRIVLIKVLMSDENLLSEKLIEQLSQIILSINTENEYIHQLAAKVLTNASAIIEKKKVKENPDLIILGCKFKKRDLRFGAEKEYRKAAQYAVTMQEKIHWITLANAVRPKTLF